MAGAYVNAGAISSTTSAAFLTPALPASLVTGNLLIAFWAQRVDTNGITLDSTAISNGWAVGDSFIGSTCGFLWAWRVVDGSEAAPKATWQTTGNGCAGIVYQYSGVKVKNPIGAFANAGGNSVTSLASATITSTVANSLILNLYAHQNLNALAAGTGYTLDSNTNGAASTWEMSALHKTTLIGSGASSTSETASWTTTARAGEFTIELIPTGAYVNNNGAGATATTATTAMPSSIVAGNLLIAEIWMAADKTFTISSGWEIIGQANLGGGGYSYGIAWKKAAGSDTTPTWSWDGTSQTYASNCSQFTGMWSGAQLVGARSVAVGNSTTCSSATIVATSQNAFIFESNSKSASTAFTPSTNYINDSNFSGGAAPGGAEVFGHRRLANVGDTSPSNAITISSGKWASSQVEFFVETPQEQATSAQTFFSIVQEIDVSEDAGAHADIDQTLPAMSQVLTIAEEEPDTIDMTLFNITQALAVNDTPNADIDQTLPGALQEILISTEIVVESIDQTLSGMLQEILIASEIEITSVDTILFPMTQDLEAINGLGTHIAMTLPGVLQEVFAATEIEITLMDQVLPGALEQILITDQTPPIVIRMTLATMISQDFEAMEVEMAEIDMTFVDMNNYPRYGEIEMVLGGCPPCVGGGGISRSGWWPG